mgnify:CR=1 FL=1
MADKMKELDNITTELIAELAQLTVAEIEDIKEDWLEKLKEDNISSRTIHYITKMINCVIESKLQVGQKYLKNPLFFVMT